MSLYRRFRDYTMVDEATFNANVALAETVRDVPGAIIECGVWRGGMIAAIAATLGPDRDYVLFDSFKGLPRAEAIDGAAAQVWQADKDGPAYHDNCAAPSDAALTAMMLAGVARCDIRAGWFAETVPAFDAPIALLRLDADWYAATMCCLTHLFDQVVPGGLIIVDDYYVWDGCAHAVHDFLSRKRPRERIRSRDDLVCYLRKN